MTERAGRTRATAVITVHKYQPSAYDEPDEGPVLTRIHVEESFTGRHADATVLSRTTPTPSLGGLT